MADPSPPRTGVDPVVDRLNKLADRIGTLEGASGTQRARTMKDLAGRVTLSAISEDDGTWTELDLPSWPLPFGPEITITLKERRVVRTVFTVLSNVQVAATNATTDVHGVIQTRLLEDGVVTDWPEMTQNSVSSGGGTGAAAYRQVGSFQTLSLTVVHEMNPGEHTIQGVLVNGTLYSTEGPGTWSGGVIQVQGPSLVVDVLQLA